MSAPDWKIRLSVPAEARRGEVIQIRTLIAHPMESGFRRDNMGKAIPRDILTELVCTYAGEVVFRAEMFPAIAANPYLSFYIVARETGTLEFRWTDQHGRVARDSRRITVRD